MTTILISFFFSSRRGYTRSKRDWSSDVCSSDLSALKFIKEFKLGTLYCQPKHDNPMPNRMLRKIGCALLSKVDWKHPGNGSIVRQNQYLVSEGVIHKYLDSIRALFAFQRETK